MPFDGIAEDFAVRSIERPRQLTGEDLAYLKTLREARQLLEDGWTQGTYQDLTEVEVVRRRLFFFKTKTLVLKTSFCILGALRQTLPVEDPGLYGRLFTRFASRPEFGPRHQIPTWNDDANRTHAEVLNLFDREIASVTA